MRRIPPWLRTLLAFPLGFAAINAFHWLAAQALPGAYAETLAADATRFQMLLLSAAAGIVGSCVAGLAAGHRLWLHIVAFALLMAAIDTFAVMTVLAPQPGWVKAALLGSLPLQALLGGAAATLALRRRLPATA